MTLPFKVDVCENEILIKNKVNMFKIKCLIINYCYTKLFYETNYYVT